MPNLTSIKMGLGIHGVYKNSFFREGKKVVNYIMKCKRLFKEHLTLEIEPKTLN